MRRLFTLLAIMGLWVEALSATSLSGSVGGLGATAARQGSRNVFWNPASIGPIDRTEFEIQAQLIGGWLTYDRQGDDRYSNTPHASSTARTIAGAPSIFIASSLGSSRFRFGYANYFPSGAMGKFSETGSQRYEFVEGLFVPWNHQLSLAYQINDQWSVGVSSIFSLAFIRLETDVDLTPFLSEFIEEDQVLREHPAMSSRASIPLSSTLGFGGSFGVLYRPSVQWSLGASLYLPIQYNFKTIIHSSSPTALEAFGPAQAAVGMLDGIENEGQVKMQSPLALNVALRYQPFGYWTTEFFGRYLFSSMIRFASVRFTDSSLLPLKGQEIPGLRPKDQWMIGSLQSFSFSRRLSFASRIDYQSHNTPDHMLSITRASFNSIGLGVLGRYRLSPNSVLGAEFAHSFAFRRKATEAHSASELRLFQPPPTDGTYRSGVSRLGVSFHYEF